MIRWVRAAAGGLLTLLALGAMVYAVAVLREHDYIAAMLLTVIGLSLIRAGTELLRPVLGE
ncbi:MAG: hypothetical protein KC416_07025 [Myxococcales bacterium]|nr:hypothetical protein [Myxococcales bacterium]